MEEFTREKQIEKISSLINRRGVSRRDFFGSLGKMVILSQVVALGASSFLASCIALEDKKGFGNLKVFTSTCPDENKKIICDGFSCPSTFGCQTDFQCEQDFNCNLITTLFGCNPQLNDFECYEIFSCNKKTGNYTHDGGCTS